MNNFSHTTATYWQYNDNYSGSSGSGEDSDIPGIWSEFLSPTTAQWFFLCFFLVVFLVSITGNTLIIIYVYRRKHLQTTVNFLMLNLALADTLVTVICLPPTVMVEFFKTWLMGRFLCKLTPYLQMTVVSVSSLSLGVIAINRWYVVCHPLQVGTSSHAKRKSLLIMLGIWIFSLITMIPIAFVTKLTPAFGDIKELEILKHCEEHWNDEIAHSLFHVYFLTVCYFIPLIVMAVTYTRVFKVLRRTKIPGYDSAKQQRHTSSSRKEIKNSDVCNKSSSTFPRKPALRKYKSYPSSLLMQTDTSFITNLNDDQELKDNDKRANKDISSKHESMVSVQTTRRKTRASYPSGENKFSSFFRKISRQSDCKSSPEELILQARKRSARMQVGLIVAFGVGYAPFIILDLLRNSFGVFKLAPQSTRMIFAVAHFMMYLSIALNPIIYNFFSAKFRKEFKKTFRCFVRETRRRKGLRRIGTQQSTVQDSEVTNLTRT